MEAQGSTAAGEGGGEAAEAVVGGPDLSPVLERLDEVVSRQETFGSELAALRAQPEAEAEPDDGLADFDFSGLYDTPGEMDEAQAARVLQGLVQQQMTPALEQAVGPLAEQLQQMRVESDARALIEQYPELGDPSVAEAVTKRADEMAKEIGNPDLAQSRQFIELVFKAQKADQRAAGEVPVGDLQSQSLEGGAGAVPGGADGQSIAQQIVGSRSRSSFWGA